MNPENPESSRVRTVTVTPLCLDGFVAGFNELLDELRCWDTDRLFSERERVLREQRRLETRELALTFVLDERRGVAEGPACEGRRHRHRCAPPARDGEEVGAAPESGERRNGRPAVVGP